MLKEKSLKKTLHPLDFHCNLTIKKILRGCTSGPENMQCDGSTDCDMEWGLPGEPVL